MDNVAGGEGIEKCSNTTKDMYYCIDENYEEANCTTEESVLVFEGMLTHLIISEVHSYVVHSRL